MPIVIAVTGDPVRAGLVTSLARPGGNMTGVTAWTPEVSRARLRLATELVPSPARVALLWNAAAVDKVYDVAATRAAGTTAAVPVDVLDVRTPDGFVVALAEAARRRVGLVIVLNDPLTIVHTPRLVELATAHQLPVLQDMPELARSGALAAYGASLTDLCRRAAVIVHKVLTGATPATLPIEPPTRLALIVNLAVAQHLGVSVPAAVLERADLVIR